MFAAADLLARLGPICLAVWLILMGVVQAFNIRFPSRDLIMGILAIIAGVVMLLNIL